MNIFGQKWFWIGIFSVGSAIVGSFLTILANYSLESSKRKTQLKLEKIKIQA